MTDVRTLLHEAAELPGRPLQVERIASRAARRRLWRWLAGSAAGLIALVGVALPIQSALTPADHGEVAVETGRPADTPQHDTSGSLRPGDRSASVRGHDSGKAPDAGGVGSVTTWQAPPPTAPLTPTTTGGTSADECEVQGGDYGVDSPPYGGAGIGGYPDCRYVAKSRAGYVAYAASWEIDVTHPDGTRAVYGPGMVVATPSSSCGPLGVIQPGDEVHVVLYTGAENTASIQSVKVGPTHHC